MTKKRQFGRGSSLFYPERVTFRLTSQDADRLQSIARHESIAVSALVRHLVVRFLDERQFTPRDPGLTVLSHDD
ncbi:MAG: hypothetical protein C0623_02230 [Desulfuromonas sp.]|nr:MAG: hypothetical protein C0623_02230 [Desulfuromonas sp.]